MLKVQTYHSCLRLGYKNTSDGKHGKLESGKKEGNENALLKLNVNHPHTSTSKSINGIPENPRVKGNVSCSKHNLLSMSSTGADDMYIGYNLFIILPILRSTLYNLETTMAIRSLNIPCLRTSSTAAVSSSLRNWLSFAIFSPFSRKFCVAVSTDAAKTWAFLERPFFLLDGPLLLEFTKVVTYDRNTKWLNNTAHSLCSAAE